MVKTMKQCSEHGRCKDSNNTFQIETIGYKYKISNIQATLGLAQFVRIIKDKSNNTDSLYYLSEPEQMIVMLKEVMIKSGIMKNNIIVDNWE